MPRSFPLLSRSFPSLPARRNLPNLGGSGGVQGEFWA
jgi:hypothetical protein